MKHIYISIFILLTGCVSRDVNLSNISSCATLNNELIFYKFNPLINCDNQCKKNKVVYFGNNLQQLFIPILKKAKKLDSSKLKFNQQILYFQQSNSSIFCGNMNKNINSIFQGTGRKEESIKKLIQDNIKQYKAILFSAKNINKNIPIVEKKVVKKKMDKKNSSTKSKEKISQPINTVKPKKNIHNVDKCKKPLQNLRYHIITKGKNNEYYLIYQNEYDKCLKLYNKRLK